MLNKIKSINWKLVGLFCLKLFMYMIVIPLAALMLVELFVGIVTALFFEGRRLGGPSGIGFQIWETMAFVIYTLCFYIYVLFSRYLKSVPRRRLMLFLFIFIPSVMGGAQFKMYFFLAVLGNLFYNGSYYLMYYSLEYFLPSFRGQLK